MENNKMDIEKNNDNIVEFNILLENVMISAMDISINYLVYSVWDENKIYILSINNNTNKTFLEFEEELFVNSIIIIKSEGMKFMFISFSNGNILFYKFNSKRFSFLPFFNSF